MSKMSSAILMILLAVCAAVILGSASQRRNGGELAFPSETQGATSSAAEETEHRDTPETDAATEPPVQQTEPQSTQPSEGTSTTAPTEPPVSLVQQILDRNKPEQTAVSHVVWDSGFCGMTGTEGNAEGANGPELARLSGERKGNPVAAFWILQSEGLYEKRKDRTGLLDVEAFSVPAQAAKAYPYTDEGACRMVTDWLMLSAGIEDGMAAEAAILGPDGAVEAGQIHHSAAENCRYGYFIVSGDRSTHILCVYLRGKEGGNIQDVEFQLLNLWHASGDTATLAKLEKRGQRQAAALMASAELLMTGSTNAGKGKIDFSRTVGGYTAKVSRYWFSADTELGSLTNYRLKK